MGLKARGDQGLKLIASKCKLHKALTGLFVLIGQANDLALAATILGRVTAVANGELQPFSRSRSQQQSVPSERCDSDLAETNLNGTWHTQITIVKVNTEILTVIGRNPESLGKRLDRISDDSHS